MTGIAGNLREDLRTFMIAFLLIFLRIRNISAKICIENQNTFDFQLLFFSENRAVYEVMWKNIVQPDRPQMAIWRKRVAC
jgi:hypothetical protein